MKKKFIGVVLCGSLLFGTIMQSSLVLAEDSENNLIIQQEYDEFINDDSTKDFDDLVVSGAKVINEYDFIMSFKELSDMELKNKGLTASEIREVRNFSPELYAEEILQLPYAELINRGLNSVDIASLKDGIYKEELLRKASSNVAFKMQKQWSNVTGSFYSGTTKAAFTIDYAFDRPPVSLLSFIKSIVLAFQWSYELSIVREQSSAKITYLPVKGTQDPGREKTIRINDITTDNPNHGGYFSMDARLYNYGSVYPGKGKAYVVIKSSQRGIKDIEVCSSLIATQASFPFLSIAIGPFGITFGGDDILMANGSTNVT